MDIRQTFYNSQKTEVFSRIKPVERDIEADKNGIMRLAKGFEPKFQVTDQNKVILSELQLYFTGSKSKYDLNKGLWLSGNPGTGKTLLIEKIFKAYTGSVMSSNSYTLKSYTELISDLYKTKFAELDKINNRSVFIDDLGVNQIMVNLYGNEINFISLLIDYRYRSFNNGNLTHITTNLYPEQFKSIVDDRTISRMIEMFNIIKLEGVDYRRQ